MTREILFRGKRVDNGEWLEGSLFFDPDLGGAQIMGFEYSTSETGIERGEIMEPVDPATVGQYTGLKDKNGKRIFEGDILAGRYDEDHPEDLTTEVVIWHMNGWYTKAGHHRPDIMDEKECLPRTEVIGNIHDNPELMGAAADGASF